MPPSPPSPSTTDTASRSATDLFHEPRREDCPWCGARTLRTRLRTTDPTGHLPGTFAVDECRGCGHVFQNPRLVTEGLALPHGDFYAGHLEDFAARVLSARAVRRRHRATAHKLSALPEPESWLDVGTGYGHFPEAAREFFVYTSFDGLDPSPRVLEARAAGRVEEAHVGRLAGPGMTTRLRGRYDVVSMFHHLQHMPDPRAELRAALAVLRPGGHLVVEVPDPRSGFAALLGRRWLPYGQPRHLHLVPVANLCAELECRGCRVLVVDRAAPHVPYDLSAAVSLAVAGAPLAVRAAAAPFATAASVLDLAVSPLARHTPLSNAYRVVARRNPR